MHFHGLLVVVPRWLLACTLARVQMELRSLGLRQRCAAGILKNISSWTDRDVSDEQSRGPAWRISWRKCCCGQGHPVAGLYQATENAKSVQPYWM